MLIKIKDFEIEIKEYDKDNFYHDEMLYKYLLDNDSVITIYQIWSVTDSNVNNFDLLLKISSIKIYNNDFYFITRQEANRIVKHFGLFKEE